MLKRGKKEELWGMRGELKNSDMIRRTALHDTQTCPQRTYPLIQPVFDLIGEF